MSTFGARLKEIRKSLGYTQSQAADKIGISQQAWQAAESDKTELSAKRIKMIANTFRTKVAWLMSGHGSMDGETLELSEQKANNLVKLISTKELSRLASKRAPKKIQTIDLLYIPDLLSEKECFAIKVAGADMDPVIKEGATIIFEKLGDKSAFQDNSIYLIVSEGIPFIKKVAMIFGGKDKGSFLLSTLKDNKTQIVKPKDISAWFKIIYVLNPL